MEGPRIFEPTLAEWMDMASYMRKIEETGAGVAGIVKIKAPSGWSPSARGEKELYNPSNMNFSISLPLQQTIKPTPVRGAFESTSQAMPELSMESFVKLATSKRYVTPAHQSYDELEKIYWDYDMIDRADDPIYGADTPATLIDDDRKIWNTSTSKDGELFNDLGKRLTRVDEGAYLYIGMWKTTFSYHIEDMDLFGINYHHYGAPKTWYCVPPSQAYRLERAADDLFPHWSKLCKNFLRHKVCMMSPTLLATYGVTVHKVVQEERDLIVVFPHAYHSGFNHGFNIAEASNFGTPRWVEHGKRHRHCTCADRDKVLLLDMEPFVARFQPAKYEDWKQGKDEALHPDDPQEYKEVWEVCREVVAGEGQEGISNELLERLRSLEGNELLDRLRAQEGDEDLEETEKMEQRVRNFRGLCKKQLQHFKMFREVLPKLGDLLDYKENKDWNDNNVINEDGDKENIVPDKPSLCFSPSKKTLKKAMKCKVKVKKAKKEHIKTYLDQLPVKTEEKVKRENSEIRSSLGFADISMEELEAKRNMKKCYYKHKFWMCKKCSGCITPDCGRCWACKDKPKFGGRGIQKQKCQERKCSNPVVRTCDHCKCSIVYEDSNCILHDCIYKTC